LSIRIWDTFRNYANAFNYTAAGAVSSMRLGNGRWENTAFNSRLQPTQIGLGGSATNTSLLKLNYGYGTTDNNGNVKSQTINTGSSTFTQTYLYDSLNRLTEAKEVSSGSQTWKQNFGYDRFGNRTSLNEYTGENLTNNQTPQINAANNRFTTASGFVYDLNGNVITDNQGRTFNYDGENKQTKVTDTSSNIVGEYVYDGDGKRVKKVVPNGETTIFVYNANSNLVAEYSTIVEPQATAKISYLTNDHLGSPRITTDALGQIISRRDFKPFGEEISRTGYGADVVRKKFTGYEKDDESSLNFAQARYQNSNVGRFTSPDEPLFDQWEGKPQTWNLYVYALNNPLRITDPSGTGHVDKDGKWVGDYDGEYDADLDAFWMEDGQYWEFGGDHTPPDIEEERDAICIGEPSNDGNCFFVMRFEPDVPGGGIIKQGGKQAAKRFGGPVGNFFKRNASKAWKWFKNGVGLSDDVVYKSADDVINAATNEAIRGGGNVIERKLKGNIDEIFEGLANEAGATIQTAANGTKYFKVGSTRIGVHKSTTPGYVGTPTLDINKAGQIYKIRITP